MFFSFSLVILSNNIWAILKFSVLYVIIQIMKLSTSISINSSSAVGFKSAKSIVSNASTDAKPFSQQFDFHLADVPIQRRKTNFIPAGIVSIYFPGIPEFEIYFRNREPVEELRKEIEDKIQISISNYYVVPLKLSLLQGIFLTQGLDPGLPYCRQILY